MDVHDRSLRHVAIVGGDVAGWMTAAMLAAWLSPRCRVTVVECGDPALVGVAEGSLPTMRRLHDDIGLAEDEFLRRTKATCKLGTQFVDWARHGQRYFHPFGAHGVAFDRLPVHQYWLAARRARPVPPLDDLSMAWAAASRGRFAPPGGDPRQPQSTHDYAYHLDPTLYARLLRERAEARGVRRVEGRVAQAELRPEDGHVERLRFEGGHAIDADLVIDCSCRDTIQQAIGNGYECWAHWLPCDRATTVPCAPAGELAPFTRATALEAGWQWRIPLQHRVGNGIAYSSRFLDDDAAAARLMSRLDAIPLGDPRPLRYAAGRRSRPWHRNVVAIGPAAGSLEPLESTRLHRIQFGIERLLAHFPDRDFDPLAVEAYNREVTDDVEAIRDLLVLHYKLTSRTDSPLWRHCATMPVPETLARRLARFRRHGRLDAGLADGPFGASGWLAVHVGQFHLPERHDPLVDLRPVDGEAALLRLREAVARAAQAMPMHEEYIRRQCEPAAG